MDTNMRPPLDYWPSEALFADKRDVISKLSTILESSYDGIYITDGQANTILVNQSYEAITGLARADVLGKNMRELIDSGVMDHSGTLLAIEKRKTVTIEQKFRTGKQAVITSTPTFDGDDIVMVVTNVRDITEIHQLKKQLLKTQELTKKQLSELEIMRRQVIGSNVNFVAVDKTTLQTLLMADKVARMDTAVLLLGETGVGKEMFASYIHQHGSRGDKQLIKVNCGAIPPHLVESELFGYERGAFTGADRDGKPGLFEVADQGTIFLDEVGELPLDVQVKLLRVIQERELQRVGSTKPRGVDIRIIAATNRDLQEMVGQKKFRKDLYYRLNVFPITIPPLRDRTDDIIPLAEGILQELYSKYGMKKTLSQSAVLELQSYAWPGNIRELRNVVERAMILSGDGTIHAQDLALTSAGAGEVSQARLPKQPISLKKMMEEYEAAYILEAYKVHGSIRKAAKSLCMEAATYQRKLKKYNPENTVYQ